ncbi:hypothetical protein D3C80_1776910 [compost metagenome]
MLFMPIIDRMTTDGNALKAIMAAHRPPKNESISRLRVSALKGMAERLAHW